MIRKVKVEELVMGMFIADLNCDWIQHDFFRASFMLKRPEDLARIRATGVSHVFIDTLKGKDLPEFIPASESAEGEFALEAPAPLRVLPPPPARTDRWEELGYAQAIQSEANHAVKDLLMAARFGRPMEMGRLEPLAERIADSVIRNPGTLVSLCRMKEVDTYTYKHCVAVGTLLVGFGRSIGLDRDQLLELGMGGILHDLGKMLVPLHILNKPGKHTAEEAETMRRHVPLGLELLRDVLRVDGALVHVAAQHHERFDGQGYPDHLQGFGISQAGRMAAIADAYDALTSNRAHRRAMEPSAALALLYEEAGKAYDPDLVQRFIQFMGVYPIGSLVRLESDRLGVVLDLGEGNRLNPVIRVVFDARRERRLTPWDLDLSGQRRDRITGFEDPADWGLDPLAYLMQPVVS